MPGAATLSAPGWKWLLAPVYFGQLFTGAKSFEANPLIGSPRLNEMGLHEKRVQLAYERAAARRAKLASLVSAEDRAAYERDGFVVKRDFLPKPEFDRLVAEVKAYRDGMEERLWGETINRKLLLDAETTAKMPSVKAVLNSPEWLNLIAYVGGCSSPPLAYIQALYRRGGEIDPQTNLHVDTFHPTTKAWLYLTDVRENEGAFTYVPGSHRLTPQKLEWHRRMALSARDSDDRETREGSFRVEKSELAGLGLPQPVELAVPANTLVVGDTSGFHARGPSVPNTLRVEIWALGRRQPFVTLGGLEPWTTESLGSMVSGLQKFGQSVGVKSSKWAFRPGVSAFDTDRPATP